MVESYRFDYLGLNFASNPHDRLVPVFMRAVAL
jgi:hypothetical protein